MNYKVLKSTNNKEIELHKVGIIYNAEHKNALQSVEKVRYILNKKNIINSTFELNPHKNFKDFDKDVSVAIVVGGDGTLLASARFYAKYGIPVLGINIGRLGFLAQTDNIEEGINKLLNNQFRIENRVMLKADCQSNTKYHALNDIAIKSGSISRTAKLFLYINDKHVCDYLADGLIVSTPTGSTAYNLSAGGPVLVPDLDVLSITPICPHALTTRPLIVSGKEKIKVKVKSDRDEIYLTADGQENVEVDTTKDICIEKSEKCAKLILIEKENNGFFAILRQKLHWGISPTN